MDRVICPFCAYMGRMIEFRLYKKNGEISRKRFKCPDCNQIMRRNTLVRKVTPSEWAVWLYASIRVWNDKDDPFYNRISWRKLLERVKRYNISSEFWDAWKEAKTYDKKKLEDIVDNAYKPEGIQLKLV